MGLLYPGAVLNTTQLAKVIRPDLGPFPTNVYFQICVIMYLNRRGLFVYGLPLSFHPIAIEFADCF